jgi:hypothetical protein
MASPTQIHVDADNTGLWHIQQTTEAADRVSSLLQEDLEAHHVYFNNDGFHNHIPHHLLSLYGTGADVGAIQKGYDDNMGYQRKVKPVHKPKEAGDHAEPATGPLADDWYETAAPQYLGHESYYPDFLCFFQHDIERRDKEEQQAGSGLAGWQALLRDRVFSGTPAADDLQARLFSGILHPLIQLMYGIEWGQPAIVAQGLAQAAIHKHQGLDDVLYRMEKAAATEEDKAKGAPVSILSLLQEVAQSPQLSSAAHWEDPNKMRDGVLARALDEMVAVAAKVSVPATEDDLAARTAEMAEACVYVAASAALHPTKHPKFDFFLMLVYTPISSFLLISRPLTQQPLHQRHSVLLGAQLLWVALGRGQEPAAGVEDPHGSCAVCIPRVPAAGRRRQARIVQVAAFVKKAAR